MTTLQDMRDRVRAEYLEMPGMRLTMRQVQRLCGLEPALCQTVLDSLVEAKFLCLNADGMYALNADGMYARLADGEVRPRPAKAALDVHARVAAAS